MKKAICIILLSGFAVTVKAQTSIDSVKAVINNLFKAMKTSDTVLLKTVFTDSAILQTINTRSGKVVVETDEVSAFIESIGKLPAGDADEQVSFDVVKVDADLAIAWTPYKFYYKGKFSHCGVNSFQLVRINNVWKIQYLIDTRRRNNCD
ncbi:MAG: nuclear transport factor 2 family protein [Ferruginibacter sp.]|nr:nuclear transport factor 2 family protein [Bacteroidota bacterium]MBX2919511.1 nuclear transport factor 2 family protein [Ferruginibacter sp.]MCB0709792.1 nuclear transport factor 2 family protein [Chitinophagaceae bacterium]MCC7379967.1 nuclear transport factor 2 family protein [Chitinophagaceae bacterium]